MWSSCAVEYYLAIKKERNSDTCYTIWMNFENIMFNKISQTQQDILNESTHIEYLEHIHRDKNISGYPGLEGGGEEWKLLPLMDTEFLFRVL